VWFWLDSIEHGQGLRAPLGIIVGYYSAQLWICVLSILLICIITNTRESAIDYCQQTSEQTTGMSSSAASGGN
jgi:hypothetical protein